MRSVLIVDDNAGDRHLLDLAIEEVGWDVRVSTANDGQEAIELLTAKAREGRLPDLVLLDLNMPRINGWDLLAMMQDSRFAGVHRLALSSSASSDDHARAVRLGAEAVYVKPYEFALLVQLVDEIRRRFESGVNRLVPQPN